MGQKSKKSKKNSSRRAQETEKRALLYKEDMEEYAKIMKALGDRRMTVILPDGTEMIAIIPGKFRKRCWMTVGDIILVSRREFQDTKLDILHKYNAEEKTQLFKSKEIPAFFMTQEATADDKTTDGGFLFSAADEDLIEEVKVDDNGDVCIDDL